MALQITLAVCAVIATVMFIAQPVLRGVDEPVDDARRAELEDAKQSKYREIRDAELDYRSGKLTHEQWEETDRELRREAMLILGKLDSADSLTEGAKSDGAAAEG